MTDQIDGHPDRTPSPPAPGSGHDTVDSAPTQDTTLPQDMSDSSIGQGTGGDAVAGDSADPDSVATMGAHSAAAHHDPSSEPDQDIRPANTENGQQAIQKQGEESKDTAEGEEEEDDSDDEDDDDDDEEDEEPRLKYARLTQSLSGVYRNGDATSSFLVGGDKMVRTCHTQWY